MFKYFIFIVSFFSCVFTFSQKHEKWLELHGSFENTPFRSHNGEVFKEKLGHSDGLNMQFFLNEKVSFITGLNLTSMLFKSDPDHVPAMGGGMKPNKDIKYSVHSSTYIFAPLMCGYQVSLGKRFYFAPRGGLQVGVPLREKTWFFYEGGDNAFDSKYDLVMNHLVFNATVATSFEFAVRERFRISLMPFLTKRISKRSSSVVFSSKSRFTYGLRGNLKFRL